MKKYSIKRDIYRYLKNIVHQKLKTQKNFLIIMGLFIFILVISYYLPATTSSTSSLAKTTLHNQTLKCLLHRVIDGDTVIVNCPTAALHQANIRIWGLDAPEMGQKPWGDLSKKHLIHIFQTSEQDIINVKILDIDQYNRYIGKIFINNKSTDVGLELIKQGFAVVYKQYNHDPQYQECEDHAKVSKLGIWQTKGSQQDPAAWRKVNPL